jgi:hypothetical protein
MIGGPQQATAHNGQSDNYNILRYGEAVDDLLDRINDGVAVTVILDNFGDVTLKYEGEILPGEYRLVAWDNHLGGTE